MVVLYCFCSQTWVEGSLATIMEASLAEVGGKFAMVCEHNNSEKGSRLSVEQDTVG